VIYLTNTSFWGQESEIDNQGRVLIHPILRQSAEIYGDVAVLGQLNYLNVWNLERIERFLAEHPFTEENAAVLARLGI
jgi:MraZ protein